jgi:exportin-2 (importin alpha re-exporter)
MITVRDRANPQGVLPQGVLGQSCPRYDPAALKPHLLQMTEPILRTIAQGVGIPQNEYLMRAMARTFAFLKEHGADAGLGTLRPFAQILAAVAENPMNPCFNHNLFEAVASIAKVCVPTQPEAVEGALLPVLGQILERNISDFLPYTFQILGLLLDANNNVKPLYEQLFSRLLTPELWKGQANVPGLTRLLRAYFCKHAVFAQSLNAHMQTILERWQMVLQNRKLESNAFDLVNAIYMYLPFDLYKAYFKTLLTVLLTRLQNNKSPKFQREFVVSCSLFVHRSAPGLFTAAVQEIQPGLLGSILTGVWIPVLEMSMKLDERKVVVLGMGKLLASCDELRQNAQLVAKCCAGLVKVLGLTPTSSSIVAEESDDDEQQCLPNGGAGVDFEVSFSKLRNTDLPGAAAGLAPDVPDLASAAKALLAPVLREPCRQLAQADANLQPLASFLN